MAKATMKRTTNSIPAARAQRSQFTFVMETSLSKGPGDSPPAPGAGQGVRDRRLTSCRDRLDARFLQGRLSRRQARQRHAVRRAGDIVEAQAVAEADRLRLAAVLAADAHLQVLLDAAAALDGDPHQLPHPALVEDLERIAL